MFVLYEGVDSNVWGIGMATGLSCLSKSCDGTHLLHKAAVLQRYSSHGRSKIELIHAFLCVAFSLLSHCCPCLQTWPLQREAGGDVNEGRTGGEETTISIIEVCAAAPGSDVDLSW